MSASQDFEENAAWVNRILKRHGAALADHVGPDRMPIGEPTFIELGCGYYGCVLATRDPGIVIKITSDASEAAFVTAALSMGKWPDGIVRYYDIIELPERYRQRHVYALWRQEAQQVGGLYHDLARYRDRYGAYDVREALEYLWAFRDAAQKVRDTVTKSQSPDRLLAEVVRREDWALQVFRDQGIPKWAKGADKVAIAKHALESTAELMENNVVMYLVGQAFTYYLGKGILLADVHEGNLGELVPEDYTRSELVITDPGQMVPLHPQWLNVAVPQLKAA